MSTSRSAAILLLVSVKALPSVEYRADDLMKIPSDEDAQTSDFIGRFE